MRGPSTEADWTGDRALKGEKYFSLSLWRDEQNGQTSVDQVVFLACDALSSPRPALSPEPVDRSTTPMIDSR